MKRHTVILPFLLPRLTDKAAAQFIDLLHQLIGGIEHHVLRMRAQHDPLPLFSASDNLKPLPGNLNCKHAVR